MAETSGGENFPEAWIAKADSMPATTMRIEGGRFFIKEASTGEEYEALVMEEPEPGAEPGPAPVPILGVSAPQRRAGKVAVNDRASILKRFAARSKK